MSKLYSTIMMLAMMVAALSFTACGDDDDDEDDVNTSALVGTWKVIEEESYIQFKNGGSFIVVDVYDVKDGTWKETDNTLLLNFENGTVLQICIVSISNKYLTYKVLSAYHLSNPSDVIYVADGITTKLERVTDSAIEEYLK